MLTPDQQPSDLAIAIHDAQRIARYFRARDQMLALARNTQLNLSPITKAAEFVRLYLEAQRDA